MTRTSRRFAAAPSLALAALLVALVAPLAPVEAQSLAGGTYFGKNKITYREFDWQVYHSPHFDVYYYDGEEMLLQKVVSLAESAYDRLSRRLDFQIQEPTPLIFYATHSAFEQNNIILNFIPEGVGAFASPARFRMVLPVDMPDADLFDLILHELTHIFEYHILFQGSLGKAIAARPPTWLMEGLASYLAADEQSWDKMYLRDAVVNDQIPAVSRTNVQGFFAYRFGHAVFEFIEERWGEEGLIDFLYEVRNTIGGQMGRAIERAFRIEAEEFDIEFRRWLRRQYLPALVATGEPSDFGRRFRVDEFRVSEETSGVAAPSGDLLASFTSAKGEIDVALFDTRRRRFLRNLTEGFSDEFQYLIAQNLTVGRSMGNDLDFSPDGNTVAAFVKRERGRSLLLVDVVGGGIRRVIDMDELGVEQQLSPTFSADGRQVAFSAWRDGQFDIFSYDLESGALTNLTDDDLFDGAPAYSPDGRTLVFTTVIDGFQKLFRIDLSAPADRYQLTSGEYHDRDATFSPDGQRVYFTSDRSGAENIYALDLASGELTQLTNAVTGAYMPTVLVDEDGKETLVYTGFWKRTQDLYLSDVDGPVTEPTVLELATEPRTAEELPRFEPDIQVVIDDANKDDYPRFKLFLEDARSIIGVNDDQTLLGQALLSFSDYLGDRRFIALIGQVESFSNFDFTYLDRSRRVQWSARLYDDRTFFTGRNFVTGRPERQRLAFRETGVVGSLIYPFNFYHRAEVGLGYKLRKFDFTSFIIDDGVARPVIEPREDNFPVIAGALVGDTAVFAPWGPIAGRRWRLSADYAPDFDDSGTLTANVSIDARQYIPVTRRSNVALRAYGAYSEGNFPTPIFFGGLDTVRGFDFRSLVGNRAFFANVEFRFPVIDLLATPLLNIQSVRGLFFFDIGGAYFSEFEEFDFLASGETRLDDAVSSYGFGFTARLLGVDVNWDFAKQWDLQDSESGFRTAFWIGTRF